MGRALGTAAAAFAFGGAAMALLGKLGGLAECLAVGLVGASLFAASYGLSARSSPSARPSSLGRELRVHG